MARIRTIKPEFFTSEDVVSLSPLARLLYIATWCEADKEGRFVWKPVTLKLRFLPGDECDILALCDELLNSNLIVLYGDGFAYIPSFTAHQHLNPRETTSQLPVPDASTTRQPRVGTRQPRDPHAQGGREGKDKRNIKEKTDGCKPPTIEEVRAYIREHGKMPESEAEAFWDHHQTRGWKLKGGQPMKDWRAAVRTWERSPYRNHAPTNGSADKITRLPGQPREQQH